MPKVTKPVPLKGGKPKSPMSSLPVRMNSTINPDGCSGQKSRRGPGAAFTEPPSSPSQYLKRCEIAVKARNHGNEVLKVFEV